MWYAFVNAILMVQREFNKNFIKFSFGTLFVAFLVHIIGVKSYKVNEKIRPSSHHRPINSLRESLRVKIKHQVIEKTSKMTKMFITYSIRG